MKELYIFNQEEKIRKILFKKKDIEHFLKDKSVYSMFCSNYQKRLEGYVIKCESLNIPGEDFIYIIYESDGDKIRIFNSILYENKVEAISQLKKMIKYFPLFGFNSKYLFKQEGKGL